MTQRDLADRAGIHFTYLSKIEHGADRPGMALVQRLDDELGAGGTLVAALASEPCSRCGAIEAEQERPLDAHQPGDSHDYELTCKVCGWLGQVTLSVEPQRVGYHTGQGCGHPTNPISACEAANSGASSPQTSQP